MIVLYQINRDKLFFCKVVIIASFVFFTFFLRAKAVDEEKEAEEPKVDVKVTSVSARVSPTLEVALPSGNIQERFVEYFNHLKLTFHLNYNFLDNSLGGDVIFSYPYKRIEPGIKFFLSLDFENTFYPQLKDNEFTILPIEKFVSRTRGIETFFKYNLFINFYVRPAFIVTDTFNGSFTTSRIINEGIDLTWRLAFIYNSLEVERPEKQVRFEGIYYQSVFDLRFRDSFDNPVSIDNRNNFLAKFKLSRLWYLEELINLNYPIKIWNEEISTFYRLGGFDSVRGYEYRSINAFRFVSFSTNFERALWKDKELKFKIRKLQASMHQFNVFLLFDEALVQDTLSLDSPVFSFTSVGTGVGFVISGRTRGHIKMDFYIAQAIQEGATPIIYFKTSFFTFQRFIEKQL
jgi:hypothetical protein